MAAAKLGALVAEHAAHEPGDVARLGTGAAVLAADEAWVYFPSMVSSGLGVALSWAQRAGATTLRLVVDAADAGVDAGRLAAVASVFSSPHVSVWSSRDRSLELVSGVVPDVAPPASCDDLVAELRAASLDVVADHGVWLGEINGLEVARVGVRDGTEACAIDIGVGAYDQFASASIDVDRDIHRALVDVGARVRPHRVAGAAPHPIGRLVRSRWLRSQIARDPSAAGLDTFEPLPLLVPRPGLNELQPAVGTGSKDGRSVAVGVSAGPDLSLLEAVAGVAARMPVAEVLLVVPSRDRHPRLEAAASCFGVPGSITTLEGDWTD